MTIAHLQLNGCVLYDQCGFVQLKLSYEYTSHSRRIKGTIMNFGQAISSEVAVDQVRCRTLAVPHCGGGELASTHADKSRGRHRSGDALAADANAVRLQLGNRRDSVA